MNDKNLLIIGFVWPEPNSSAAGCRMLQLIDFFLEWDYKIIFASTALENEYNFDLSVLKVEKINIQLNSDTFDATILSLNPSIVLFDRFTTEEQFGWRVSKNCPDALKILDTEDLHCLRMVRGMKVKQNLEFQMKDLLSEDLTKREIASILRSDLTLMVSEFEMKLLNDFFKIDSSLLFYLPIVFSDEQINYSSSIPFDERVDFMFIGNFWHEPNWDAVLYLKKEIWPLIRKELPKAKLKIYGAYPSQKVFDLQNKTENFYVLGRADDAQMVSEEARVLLAPLRFGAGIKGKLLEAMQYGTPSVTTSIGAESINNQLTWNGFIANNPIEFASKAVLLYEDEALWKKSQDNGRVILQRRFCKVNFAEAFEKLIKYLLLNRHSHRENNFMGALLSHHSMKSTEYMSRWIQEKNKNLLS
ncbi:glycosyltransferase family 4 protein [Flavobacterium sp. SM2513]|uniref:glycosyltransferase family 4 protein n=1 Tax=Flavobacterium sp. SM2513 TaxID=3424766 RepID=UPI003D7F54E6